MFAVDGFKDFADQASVHPTNVEDDIDARLSLLFVSELESAERVANKS